MSLGHELLEELGRRGRRYGRLLYDQHQELKQVDSHAELNAFLARHEYSPVGHEATVPEIVDALIAQWWRRDMKGAFVAFLAAPEGWILLILLSPLLLVGYLARALYRFLTNRTSAE